MLFCLFIMFSFINWLNYRRWKMKGSCNTATQHKIKRPLPLASARAGTEAAVSRSRTLPSENMLCSGLHSGDSSSQPHNHTTQLERQFLEMTVSERFIMATNSQQNKRVLENFYRPRIINIRKQLTPFHQKNPVSKSKT